MKPKTDWKTRSDDEMVCFCSQVKKGEIVVAIMNGAATISNLQKATSAGIGNRCSELNPKGHCCHSDLADLIEIYATDKSSPAEICRCHSNDKETE